MCYYLSNKTKGAALVLPINCLGSIIKDTELKVHFDSFGHESVTWSEHL